MTPVTFPEANAHFGPPPGVADTQVVPIHAYSGVIDRGSMEGAQIIVTAWAPDADELARLNAGARIFLTFIGGLPPHMITTDFRQAIAPK